MAKTDVIVIFHFRLFFPFNPPKTNQPKKKKKFLENWKKCLQMPSFYTWEAQIMIR